MNFEDRFNAEWIEADGVVLNKRVDILENELKNIKSSITFIEEKQRRLANLAKLYT